MNSLLTVEEVKGYLDIDQHQIEKYLKDGSLQAYKIGGTYLRFRKEEVLLIRERLLKKIKHSSPVSVISRIWDFWRFNNFYIVSLLIVIALAILVVKT